VLQSYDAGEYDSLVAKYEKLNWRMISKPGGATVKPDDFYSLYGCRPHEICMYQEHDVRCRATCGSSAGRQAPHALTCSSLGH
jgi:hypothetical protein